VKTQAVHLGLHFALASGTGSGWPDIYAGCLEQCEAAEAYGFFCAVVAEHHFQADGFIPSPLLICSAIAARTRRLRIGTDVIPLPLQNPIHLAEDIATLDNLSNGRAFVGLGLGGREHEYAGFGVPFKERRARFEESLAVLKRLLSEQDVEHAGRYLSVPRLTVTPRPVQRPRPPIWIAGGVGPSVRRAAREGDAWINRPVESLDQLKVLDAIYREELAGHGKAWSERERVLRRDVWIAEDDDTAWAEAMPSILAIRHFGPHRDVLPPGASMEEVKAHARDRWIIGGPQTVVEEIQRYQSILGTTVVLAALQHPGMSQKRVLDAIRMLGERVSPTL
jgi:alkanesulfonate monooxygenase SsuD/methylene tetrahydromethanopterin reductase-like flavin-dependent oxidoreductase (luciferase family)